MQPVPTGLLPCETSFSRPEGPGNEKGTGSAEIEGPKKMPLELISPNHSFSFPPIGAEKAVSVSADEGEPARKRKRSRSRSVTPVLVVEPLNLD